jgi:hypothetical protein
MPDMKLGDLLVSNGLITAEQLEEALSLQSTPPCRPLGQILCQLGYLSAAKLNQVLDFNRKRMKLGDILVRGKYINEAKLDNALSLSAKEGIPLGKALTKLNYIDEQMVAKAIASQYDLPFVSLHGYELSTELAQFVNVKYAAKHRIVAIEMTRRSVTLAMAFPLSSHLLQELESVNKCSILPVIAAESDIYSA